MDNKQLENLAKKTQSVYQKNALLFSTQRSKTFFEKPWLDRFLNLIPVKAEILDLGCGTGEPIASYFMNKGHRVVGVDASNNMLELARSNLPHGNWLLGDMRSLELQQHFHGIIGWNSFFHLTRDEQRAVLPRIAEHLELGGALMLTVGPSEGEVAGTVGADAIYHSSLSLDEYRSILNSNHMELLDFVPEDPDCGGSTILLAQKKNRAGQHVKLHPKVSTS